MGRKRKLSAEQANEILNAHLDQKETPGSIARRMNLSYSLVYNSLRRDLKDINPEAVATPEAANIT